MAPNHDDTTPAASSTGPDAAAPKTKGMRARRTSRRSKNGCGNAARSFASFSGATVSFSELEASMRAHRLVCAGSSHSRV